ncbi:beta-1,3-galactosyl-O-glycosyl-glycoprotein beta-1,6-N-acetylglucosaminyltransferase-like [Saccostrea echinata]|uniref:beta-1,3-galactosyl-O-glycosyl-glycoprotein beta-1,6-N-acetylglucosaminyltransferase-like n=1 Tax=Saccostrea echinata TaxID=191078 RepID=UPI002A838767|nr:beta-1,3-galactosyl-O-glycosyl-glycoprotein beta-1,6-N-acetylglucosaminyltransferase-like [Saccostrea echinata]
MVDKILSRGQEFPLRTNYEIVKILKIYNGANDLESTIKRANKVRWLAAGTPPNQIRPVKGSVHITVNRKFVEYVVNNPVAKDFLNWTMRVAVPDETFFASLNHNPHLQIPGSYKGEPETDRFDKPFLTRFKNWGTGVFNWPCHGRRVRQICIFGIGDLSLLARRPEFFANKFYLYYQTYALQCMEELHYNRTRDEYQQQLEFQIDYYENLEFIKHVV